MSVYLKPKELENMLLHIPGAIRIENHVCMKITHLEVERNELFDNEFRVKFFFNNMLLYTSDIVTLNPGQAYTIDTDAAYIGVGMDSA